MDSFALLTHQLPRRGVKCLDLCSGPGVQALYAARAGEIVTSMEINPVATEYGLDILLNIVNCFSIERGADYFNGLAQTSHEYCGIPLEQIENAMEQCFTSQKATEFIVFYLYARLGTGNFTVQNLSGIGNAGLWYL